MCVCVCVCVCVCDLFSSWDSGVIPSANVYAIYIQTFEHLTGDVQIELILST